MDEVRTTAVVASSIGGTSSKRRCLFGPVVTWASLPLDLLLEILRLLQSTAVLRCAAIRRPWRRAIIGNASFLRPRPDRFVPRLLLGVFHGYGYYCEPVFLRRTAGPLQSAFPLTVAAGYTETAQSFIPSAAAAIAGKSQQEYGELLSSRDGFILLRGRKCFSDLCLCSPLTGDCTFVPNATITFCTYILLTGCDLSLPTSGSAGDDDLAMRILAVDGWNNIFSKENRIRYQLFSFTSGSGAGVWGPVRHSMELQQDFWALMRSCTTVVCRDVVHWLGSPRNNDRQFTWSVALDLHTGRTWITELPVKSNVNDSSTLLATTGDGRLSLILRSLIDHQIHVWVLNSDNQWTLQHTVDVLKQLPHCPADYFRHPLLNAFCPRSGSLLASFADKEIRIDLKSGPCPRVECMWEVEGGHCTPYEMDWSTYISNMKRF